MVGDRIDNDIVPARALGWRTIWIRRATTAFKSRHASNGPPDVQLDSAADVPEIVARSVAG